MIYMKQISTISEKRTSLTVYMFFIAVGIVIGTFLAKSPSLAGNKLINQYFMVPNEGVRISSLISGTFLLSFFIIVMAFFFGSSAFGQPFGIFLLLYRGIGIGISASSMYISSGAAAIIPVAVTVLPKAVAFSVIAALAVRENIHYSCHILSHCFFNREYETIKGGLKLWSIKLIVLIVLSLIISSADGTIYFFFTSVGGK